MQVASAFSRKVEKAFPPFHGGHPAGLPINRQPLQAQRERR